jgi:hypothetical protein
VRETRGTCRSELAEACACSSIRAPSVLFRARGSRTTRCVGGTG